MRFLNFKMRVALLFAILAVISVSHSIAENNTGVMKIKGNVYLQEREPGGSTVELEYIEPAVPTLPMSLIFLVAVIFSMMLSRTRREIIIAVLFFLTIVSYEDDLLSSKSWEVTTEFSSGEYIINNDGDVFQQGSYSITFSHPNFIPKIQEFEITENSPPLIDLGSITLLAGPPQIFILQLDQYNKPRVCGDQGRIQLWPAGEVDNWSISHTLINNNLFPSEGQGPGNTFVNYFVSYQVGMEHVVVTVNGPGGTNTQHLYFELSGCVFENIKHNGMPIWGGFIHFSLYGPNVLEFDFHGEHWRIWSGSYTAIPNEGNGDGHYTINLVSYNPQWEQIELDGSPDYMCQSVSGCSLYLNIEVW